MNLRITSKSSKKKKKTEEMKRERKKRKERKGNGSGSRYRPDVSGDEDDDGKRAEPGVSDCEEHVSRGLWSREVPQRENHHAYR